MSREEAATDAFDRRGFTWDLCRKALFLIGQPHDLKYLVGQNRSDRQLRPPSSFRNSDTSTSIVA